MRTPLHGSKPPFKLPSNIVYFHDWRYVNPGSFRWVSLDGKKVPMWGLQPLPAMRLEQRDMPLGIRLVAKPAQRTDPVLTPEGADESFLFLANLIYEESRYRLWYDCWPKDDLETPRIGSYNLVRYAESDNGLDWRLPKVGLVEYQGSRQNNIVYGGALTPESGYHGGCVFKDPSAPLKERYKAFHLGTISQEKLAEYRLQRPDDVDPFYLGRARERVPALFGGVSPDGLKWTPLPEPLVVQTSDTHNICCYDTTRGKYVAYVRSWYMGRRTIGYMETDDFKRFPLPEELFWPNASSAPYDLWYANAKTTMPNTTDYHVMFPMRWSLVDDHFDFHLATSPDGIVWGFVPGGPVCVPGNPGAWDGGVVAPGLGLVPLPEERMGILVSGSAVPHKHPRRPPLGALGWAWWPKGRLVALEAAAEGSFALYPLLVSGHTVHLNLRTALGGYIQVEAAGGDGKVLPGRSFNDCDQICGDQIDRLTTWRGESNLSHIDDSPIILRFRLRSAELFSVEFV